MSADVLFHFVILVQCHSLAGQIFRRRVILLVVDHLLWSIKDSSMSLREKGIEHEMLQIVRLLLAYRSCRVGEKREMIRRDSTATSSVCERERKKEKINLTNIGICMQVTLPVREHHHLAKYASCNNRRERKRGCNCLFFWSSIGHVFFSTFSRFDSSVSVSLSLSLLIISDRQRRSEEQAHHKQIFSLWRKRDYACVVLFLLLLSRKCKRRVNEFVD